jgi:hypothetical protein
VGKISDLAASSKWQHLTLATTYFLLQRATMISRARSRISHGSRCPFFLGLTGGKGQRRTELLRLGQWRAEDLGHIRLDIPHSTLGIMLRIFRCGSMRVMPTWMLELARIFCVKQTLSLHESCYVAVYMFMCALSSRHFLCLGERPTWHCVKVHLSHEITWANESIVFC